MKDTKHILKTCQESRDSFFKEGFPSGHEHMERDWPASGTGEKEVKTPLLQLPHAAHSQLGDRDDTASLGGVLRIWIRRET